MKNYFFGLLILSTVLISGVALLLNNNNAGETKISENYTKGLEDTKSDVQMRIVIKK